MEQRRPERNRRVNPTRSRRTSPASAGLHGARTFPVTRFKTSDLINEAYLRLVNQQEKCGFIVDREESGEVAGKDVSELVLVLR